MGVSIVDVAREAGVSVATVSRTLSCPEHVADSTARKVREAADRLGYTLRQPSRKQHLRSIIRIMLLLPVTDESVLTSFVDTHALIHLIEQQFKPNRTEISVKLIPARLKEDLDLGRIPFDGIICAYCDLPAREIQRLEKRHQPVVHINRRVAGGAFVAQDHEACAKLLLEKITEQGHRKVFVIGDLTHPVHAERAHQLTAACESFGLRLEPVLNLRSLSQINVSTLTAVTGSGASAVIGLNDLFALRFMILALQHGLKIPQTLSVAGFDASPVAGIASPSLATIPLQSSEMARHSVDWLRSAIMRNETGILQKLMQPQWAAGSSLGPVPLHDGGEKPD